MLWYSCFRYAGGRSLLSLMPRLLEMNSASVILFLIWEPGNGKMTEAEFISNKMTEAEFTSKENGRDVHLYVNLVLDLDAVQEL